MKRALAPIGAIVHAVAAAALVVRPSARLLVAAAVSGR
jgi:hypothetical protein